ncbi:MAG: hypothetical protein JW940_17835 [Polyangiaceae bacterium]|nr:hypothetical protein [Polyangiaceae bacterium]
MADLGALSDAERQAIFGAIDTAEAKADQRVARRQPSQLETDVAAEIEAGATPATPSA